MDNVFFRTLITKSLVPNSKADDERFFEGLLTVEMKDKQGEITIVDELYKVLPTWMDRGAPITDTHSNRVVGKGINFAKTEAQDAEGNVYPAIKITGKIHKDYELDDDIWKKITSGEYKGLSFGGATKADREPVKMKDGSIAYALTDLEHYEVAVCEDPAVPLALITQTNPIAKAKMDCEDLGNGNMLIKCDKFGCYVTKPDFSSAQGDQHSMYNQDVDRDTSSGRKLGVTTDPTIADQDEGTTDAGWTGTGHQQPKSKDNVTKPKPGHKDGEITKPIPDGKGGKGSFDECESKNQDKKDPGAFCGSMQNGAEGKKKDSITQGRYGGVRGLGGYNTAQQGSEPIAQISEVKRQIEDTEKALADLVEDKKTPSSEGNAQGSHTIKTINQLEINARMINLNNDVNKILPVIGAVAGALGRGALAAGNALGRGAQAAGGAVRGAGQAAGRGARAAGEATDGGKKIIDAGNQIGDLATEAMDIGDSVGVSGDPSDSQSENN